MLQRATARVDLNRCPYYSNREFIGIPQMPAHKPEALEQKIDQLIALCKELNAENQILLEQRNSWYRERQSLVEQNQAVKNKVSAVLAKLQAMERSA